MVSAFPDALKSAQGIRGVMTTRVAEIEKSLAAKTCPLK
jgi:hypothetical protein